MHHERKAILAVLPPGKARREIAPALVVDAFSGWERRPWVHVATS
jgi:hypothetical protein